MKGIVRLLEFQKRGGEAFVTRLWEGHIDRSLENNGFGREIQDDRLIVGWWKNDQLNGKAI